MHAIVDDHSRLAYAEIHDNQQAQTVIGFFQRALAFYAQHGITCKRLMTDNCESGWRCSVWGARQAGVLGGAA